MNAMKWTPDLTPDWVVYGTGGGCEALQRQDGRHYWLITEAGDPSVPDDMNSPCTLGLFDDADGSFLGSVECEDVWQAMELSKLSADKIDGFAWESEVRT